MVKRIVPALIVLSAVAAFFLWSPMLAAARTRAQDACDVTWANASGGLWHDGANWSGGAVPDESDDVCINLDGTYTVIVDESTTVRRVRNGASSGTQTLWIRGNGNESVTLTALEGFVNTSVVGMESDEAGVSTGIAVNAGTLINTSAGVMNVNAGAGGSRTINAKLDNRGVLNVNRTLTVNKPGVAHVNSGTIRIDGGSLDVVQSGEGASFTNEGTITVSTGRSLNINGGQFSSAAPAAINGGGNVNIQGAKFSGTGTVVANVNNAGELNPGTSTGTLAIAGDYAQASSGIINLELSEGGFDQLNIRGNAALAGLLNVSLVEDFRPAPCSSYPVLNHGARTGGFAVINGLGLGSGLFLRVDLRANGLALTAYSASSEVNVSPTEVNAAEGGASATYHVCLASPPTSDVTVAVSPNSQVTAAPGSLLFPLTQWNAIASVTVTAVDDAAAEGAHTGRVAHSVSSGDARYNGVPVPSVTVHIADNDGTNAAPVASNLSVTAQEDSPLAIMLVGTDADGDVLTYAIVSGPSNGTLSAVSGSGVTYTPKRNFNGSDSFTYRASDGKANSNVATVTITVTPVNDAPDARDDRASTTRGVAVDIPVLSNDADVDGDTLTVISVTQGASGAVTVNANGTVRYAPSSGFVGQDSFTYTVSDGHGGTDTATVRVNVGPAAQDQPGRIEFTGFVQALPNSGLIGTWKVQGLSVKVDESTRIDLKSASLMGALVKVQGSLMADGVVHAAKIEVKTGDDRPAKPTPPGWKDRDDDDEIRWPPPCQRGMDWLPPCQRGRK